MLIFGSPSDVRTAEGECPRARTEVSSRSWGWELRSVPRVTWRRRFPGAEAAPLKPWLSRWARGRLGLRAWLRVFISGAPFRGGFGASAASLAERGARRVEGEGHAEALRATCGERVDRAEEPVDGRGGGRLNGRRAPPVDHAMALARHMR
jgi:hypothetical protein